MKTITDEMLIERCDSEATAAAKKAEQLFSEGRGGQMLLFERAVTFWLDLSGCVLFGLPLTREKQFVLTYLRNDMGNPAAWNGVVTKRGKRKAVAS